MAILTNGGSACPLNALIRAACESAFDSGGVSTIYGIEDGYRGLMTKNQADFRRIVDDRQRGRGGQRMQHADDAIRLSEIPSELGGSILKCKRGSPCREAWPGESEDTEVDPDKLAAIERNLGCPHARRGVERIDVLVIIGGNGTAKATRKLAEALGKHHHGHPQVVFLPRTIDNDVGALDNRFRHFICPGYPSAVRYVAEQAQRMRREADTCERVYVMQTQGRDGGWVAAAGALDVNVGAGDPADIVVVPEVDITDERDMGGTRFALYDRIREVFSDRRDRTKRGSVIVMASEGIRWEGRRPDARQFGRQLAGPAAFLAEQLQEALRKYGIEVRPHHTDYVPRMGDPIEYDILLAQLTGGMVGGFIKDGKAGAVPVLELRTERTGERMPPRYSDLVNARPGQGIGQTTLDKLEQRLLDPIEKFYSRETLYVTPLFMGWLRNITSGRGAAEDSQPVRTEIKPL